VLIGLAKRRHGALAGRLVAMVLAATLAACASSQPTPQPAVAMVVPPPLPSAPSQPRIVNVGRPLQCVEYAREMSGIELRGDAWSWWDAAQGRFARGHEPEPGSLLVFRQRGASAGHLVYVTQVLGDRLLVANHANWLNDRLVHENTPIVDVSEAGDWSAVRVWYIPGNSWGVSVYPTYGFIYPRGLQTAQAGVP